MSWYCKVALDNPLHKNYHDTEYGFPLTGESTSRDECYLFELLSLELFQAGLSWELILKKRKTTIFAFNNFDIDVVASYCKRDITRLMADSGIIRNNLKITSIIENAKSIQKLRKSHGGFANWIALHHPLNRYEWTMLFRENFKFMGKEIVNEFLMCIGYLPGSHHKNCPIYRKIAELEPPWMQTDMKVFEQ